MAEPVPNNLRSLEEAILKKFEAIDPLIHEAIEKYDSDDVARPRITADGKKEYVMGDGRVVPLHEALSIALKRDDYGVIVRHYSKEITIAAGEIFSSGVLSEQGRVEKLVKLFDSASNARSSRNPFQPDVELTDLTLYKTIMKSCRDLCAAYLEKQQAAGKDSSFGGPGS